MEPDKPYSLSLAIRIASASSSKAITETTGPKISSRYARSFVSLGVRTVGANQKPGPEGLVPWKAIGVPSGTNSFTRSS